jgi:hypothetical protein
MRVPWVRVSGWLSFALLACLSLGPPIASATDLSDEAAAGRVLGPQWRLISRRAGIIFTGTVLSPGSAVATHPGAPYKLSLGADFVALRFRVDRPIAGVEPAQVLTIHQWIGASPRLRPLHPGDRVLLFLYPPSRLGLTSPVGGPQGQFRLDPSGQHVIERSTLVGSPNHDDQEQARQSLRHPVSVSQLERAIQAARGE